MSFRRIRALFICFSRRKLSKCVIALFQLTGGVLSYELCLTWSGPPQRRFQISPAGYKFCFVEDSISIEFNIFLYSCYKILVALGIFVRCMRRVLPSLYIIGLSYIWNLLKRSKTWNKTTTRVSGNHVSRQTKHRSWSVLDASILPQVNSLFLLKDKHNFLKFWVKLKFESV